MHSPHVDSWHSLWVRMGHWSHGTSRPPSEISPRTTPIYHSDTRTHDTTPGSQYKKNVDAHRLYIYIYILRVRSLLKSTQKSNRWFLVLVWVAFVARGNIFHPTGELTIQMVDLKGRNMVFIRYAAARVICATREPPATSAEVGRRGERSCF